jgi:hypothetical protein
LETPGLGNEDGVVSKQGTPGKPTTRRYTVEEKAQAVRLVRQLRAETGQRHGAVKRVAGQLGYGVESVRNWVLCRRRHNTHYADLRVMPTRVSVSLVGGDDLCDLLKEYGLGVQVKERIVEDVSVNAEFFNAI